MKHYLVAFAIGAIVGTVADVASGMLIGAVVGSAVALLALWLSYRVAFNLQAKP